MTRPVISGIAPFFVARNAAAAVAFYRDKFGFDVICQEPDHDLFFAIVCRDGAMLMVKRVAVNPEPNPTAIPRPGGMLTSMCPILMRWLLSSRRVESSFPCR